MSTAVLINNEDDSKYESVGNITMLPIKFSGNSQNAKEHRMSPSKSGFCIRYYVFSLAMSLVMWSSLLYSYLINHGQATWPFVVFGIACVLYLLECYFCDIHFMFRKPVNRTTVAEFVEKLRATDPTIEIKAKGRGAKSNLVSTTRYFVNFNTVTIQQFKSVEDSTVVPHDAADDSGYVVLYMTKQAILADEQTGLQIQNFYNSFRDSVMATAKEKSKKYQTKLNLTFTNEMKIEDFADEVLIHYGERSHPCIGKGTWFGVFSLIGISWVYRMWFLSHCDIKFCHVVKRISL